MSGFIQLRTSLIKLLVSHELSNFKVMDACCPTNCSLTADIGEQIVELKKITAKDGVHFIDAGYRKIAERCTACISVLLAGDNKPCQRKPTLHFWRGFRSHRGSLLPKLGSSTHHGPTEGTGRSICIENGKLSRLRIIPPLSSGIIRNFKNCEMSIICQYQCKKIPMKYSLLRYNRYKLCLDIC